jgi:hypothetical protein
MWLLEDSWRCGAASLAALTLLSACHATRSDPAGPSPSPATVTSAPMTTVAAPTTERGARTEKWVDLQVGDCLGDPPPSDPSVVTVSVVDCAMPHSAEVYLRADVEVNDAIADVADQRCDAGLAQYTGQSVGTGPFAPTYLIDSKQDRTSDNPLPSTVICLLQAADGGPLTGTARR